MHLNIVQCLYASVLVYIIALAVLATRSIWTGVIMHFFNNGIGVWFSYASANGWFGGKILNKYAEIIDRAGFFVYAGLIFGAFCLILLIVNMFARENHKKDNPGAVVTKKLNLFNSAPYYVNNGVKRTPMNALEKTFFIGIIVLGSIITMFTFIWGLL